MGERVTPIPDGGVRVQLPASEHELLRSLPDQLRPVLRGEHDVSDVRARLFPPAYHDPDEEAEYRAMMGEAVAEERLAALEAFAETLAGARRDAGGWGVELDAEQSAAWLSAVNDARLVLAAVVGITSEDQLEGRPDPEQPATVALWYLGWLQEELIEALTDTSPPG